MPSSSLPSFLLSFLPPPVHDLGSLLFAHYIQSIEFYPSVCLPVCLFSSVPTCLFVGQHVCLIVCVCVWLPVCLSVCLPAGCLSFCMHTYIRFCLSVCF